MRRRKAEGHGLLREDERGRGGREKEKEQQQGWIDGKQMEKMRELSRRREQRNGDG